MWLKAFEQLSQLLQRYQSYWQFQPMQQQWPQLPAPLQQALRALSLADCAAIDNDLQRQAAFFAPWLADVFTQQPAIPHYQGAATDWPFWLSTDIPGRKWQQISLFAAATARTDLPVLEWCAGKGHLGRLIAYSQRRQVLSLEWQQSLCEAGAAKADKLGLPQQFQQVDVLNAPIAGYFQAQQQWLALHACGDLHRVGLQQAIASGCQAIALLPCCYHLQQASHYQPMSVAGRGSGLLLDKTALRLAVQQHCTGGERVRRLSQTEMLWRQLWRLWAQQQGRPYQALRSVGKHWFSGALSDFLQFAATQHQLAAPPAAQLATLLQAAEQALLAQRQLEVLQHVFRRPLELWLVLDMALALQDAGYQLSLQQLCDPDLTPRNLLIQAWRQPSV